jgi:YHS domain-containing protein
MPKEDEMAKRRPRPGKRPLSAEEKLMRQWRGCGVIILVVVLLLAGLYAALNLFRDRNHAHKAAPHGGVVVSLEEGGDHYHVEAVVEKGGTLMLYTFGEDMDQVLEVESQVITAEVKREADGEFLSVDLMPMPRPGDPEDRTTRFFGRLPQELRGSPLVVRVASIEIKGKRFPLDFTVHASPHGEANHNANDEEKLYLTAGGKFTGADIAANGRQTAGDRYKGWKAEHHMKPRRGDRFCPITRIKANREYTWVVSGKTYEFCCPPCIDQFVRLAREEPQTVREPEEYVKK